MGQFVALQQVILEEVGKNGRLLGNADIPKLRPKIFEALQKQLFGGEKKQMPMETFKGNYPPVPSPPGDKASIRRY